MAELKRQFAASVVWKILENVSKLAASLISLPILARILSPADFGIMQMGLPIVLFLATIGDIGLSPALIRDKAPPRELWISAIWLNLGSGIALTCIMYFIAPLLAAFYQEPRALPLFETLSIVPFVFCAGVSPAARLQRDMRFRAIALVEVGSTLMSIIVVIWWSLEGAGAMALVYQQLTYHTLRTSLSWVLARPPIGILLIGHILNGSCHSPCTYWEHN